MNGKQLFAVLKKVCKGNNTVMTDQFSGYNILDKKNERNFVRLKIDHTVTYSLRPSNPPMMFRYVVSARPPGAAALSTIARSESRSPRIAFSS